MPMFLNCIAGKQQKGGQWVRRRKRPWAERGGTLRWRETGRDDGERYGGLEIFFFVVEYRQARPGSPGVA